MTKKIAPEKPQDAKNIFATYSPKGSEKDTGSPESQIAQLTYRIKTLTTHLQKHKKDKDALQRGLKKMVGRRQRVLVYLNEQDPTRYKSLCTALSIKGIR